MRKFSWKTTLFGAGGLVALAVPAISAQFDGDPSTVANWQPVVGGVFTAVALYFARDNAVTSEQAGVK